MREAHRRELIDDYVELIWDLRSRRSPSGGYGRAPWRLQPTVAKMLKRPRLPADRNDPLAG